MNRRGVEALLGSKVKLGGSASAAAGPKGRDVSAATDATMRAEILSYSRTRGLFAGVSLDGASLRPDDDASEQVYGRRITARTIVNATGLSVPAAGHDRRRAREERPATTQSDPLKHHTDVSSAAVPPRSAACVRRVDREAAPAAIVGQTAPPADVTIPSKPSCTDPERGRADWSQVEARSRRVDECGDGRRRTALPLGAGRRRRPGDDPSGRARGARVALDSRRASGPARYRCRRRAFLRGGRPPQGVKTPEAASVPARAPSSAGSAKKGAARGAGWAAGAPAWSQPGEEVRTEG